MPHQHDRTPRALRDPLQSPLEPQQRAVRTVDIQAESPTRTPDDPSAPASQPSPTTTRPQPRTPESTTRDRRRHARRPLRGKPDPPTAVPTPPASAAHAHDAPTNAVRLEDHRPARIRGSVPLDGGRLRHRPSVVANADNTANVPYPAPPSVRDALPADGYREQHRTSAASPTGGRPRCTARGVRRTRRSVCVLDDGNYGVGMSSICGL